MISSHTNHFQVTSLSTPSALNNAARSSSNDVLAMKETNFSPPIATSANNDIDSTRPSASPDLFDAVVQDQVAQTTVTTTNEGDEALAKALVESTRTTAPQVQAEMPSAELVIVFTNFINYN